MQHNRNDGRLQAGSALDGQIDQSRRFRLNPVAEAAQRAVGDNRRADAGGQYVESGVTRRALHDRFDLAAVLVVVAQRRQCDLGLSRFAIAQDCGPRRGREPTRARLWDRPCSCGRSQ